MIKDPCFQEHELSDFDLGNLPAAKYRQLAEHLNACENCAARFELLTPKEDSVVAQLRLSLPEEILMDDPELDCLAAQTVSLLDTSVAPIGEATTGTSAKMSEDLQKLVGEILDPPQSEEELGRLGHYRVLNVLGAGGMGVVFRAEDTVLHRIVALKAMNPAAASDSAARERFLLEARGMAAIDHDHVITIHQVGEGGSIPFLAMQMLKGETLGARLQREGALNRDEALRIISEVASGLEAAHQNGLVHRDIKPENIWLEEGTGRVKILDFGLARSMDAQQQLTRSGFIVGTPSYLSPEQVSGLNVDARSDLFSLGVVLYEMLCGQKPFQRGTLMATLKAIGNDDPESLKKLDPSLEPSTVGLVNRLLAKNPSDRYQSAAEVIAAADACREQANLSRTVSSAGFVPPRRRPVLIWMGGLAALLFLAGIIVTIRDKDGNIIARLYAPEESTVVVAPDKADADGAKISEADKPPPKIVAHRDAKTGRATAPLSPMSLVQEPAKLAGVASWTWETDLHRGRVHDLKFRPDGSLLTTAGEDGTVRLWIIPESQEPQSAKNDSPLELVRIIAAHQEAVRTLDWSVDGKVLATGSGSSIRLWDANEGRLLKEFKQGSNLLLNSPDNKWLATRNGAGKTTTIEVLSTKDGSIKQRIRGEYAVDMTWTPDSAALVVGYAKPSAVTFWDIESGEPDRHFEDFESSVSSLALSPDGDNLALGTSKQGRPVRIYDSKSGEVLREAPPAYDPAGPSHVELVAWSPTGKHLYESRYYGWGNHWTTGGSYDLTENKKNFNIVSVTDSEYATAQYSPNGESLAVLSKRTGNLSLVSAFTGKKAGNHRLAIAGYGNGVTKSADGRFLARSTASSWKAATWVWENSSAPRILANYSAPQFVKLRWLAWSPTDYRLLEMNRGGGPMGQVSSVLNSDQPVTLDAKEGTAQSAEPAIVQWASDGRKLLVGCRARNRSTVIHVYDAENGSIMKAFDSEDSLKTPPRWSPSAEWIAWSTSLEQTEIWRVGEESSSIISGRFLGWHAKEDQLLVLNKDTVELRDAEGRQVGARFEYLASSETPRISWSRDAEQLALTIPGKSVALLDVAARVSLGFREASDLQSSEFLPDGSGLVLCGKSGWEVWQPQTKEPISISKQLAPLADLSIQTDGERVWSSDAAQIGIWDVRQASLLVSYLQLSSSAPVVEWAKVTGEGHFTGHSGIERRIRAVVQLDSGQQLTVSPAEFESRFSWKNDPTQVTSD